MTFREQVRLAWAFGISIAIIGSGKLIAGGGGASPFLSLGATIVLLGGIIRPALRRSFFNHADPTARQTILSGSFGAFWRRWLAVDETGAPND